MTVLTACAMVVRISGRDFEASSNKVFVISSFLDFPPETQYRKLKLSDDDESPHS